MNTWKFTLLVFLSPCFSLAQKSVKKEPLLAGVVCFTAAMGTSIPVGQFNETHQGGLEMDLGVAYSFKKSVVSISWDNRWLIKQHKGSSLNNDIYIQDIAVWYSRYFSHSKRFSWGGGLNYSWLDSPLKLPMPEDPNKKNGIGAGLGLGYDFVRKSNNNFSVQIAYNYLRISNRSYNCLSIGIGMGLNLMIVEKQRK